jgi:GAF domain-containing protein
MRGWLAVPLIGSDGDNYGFIQVSDRLEGDFTAQDEANLLRLASLTATAWTRSRNFTFLSTGPRSRIRGNDQPRPRGHHRRPGRTDRLTRAAGRDDAPLFRALEDESSPLLRDLIGGVLPSIWRVVRGPPWHR